MPRHTANFNNNVFTGQPIVYDVINSVLSTGEQKASFILNLSSSPMPMGEYIHITIPDNAPDVAIYEFTIGGDFTNDYQIKKDATIEEIVAYLYTVPGLADDFIIERNDTNEILFTSRLNTARFNFFDFDSSFASFTQATVGENPTPHGKKCALDVHLIIDDSFTLYRQATLIGNYDKNLRCAFDVSKILQRENTPPFDIIFSSSNIMPANNLVHYALTANEQDAAGRFAYTADRIATAHALSCIGDERRDNMLHEFLTNNKNVRVNNSAHNWVAFCATAVTDIIYDIIYTDGTTDTGTDSIADSTLPYYYYISLFSINDAFPNEKKSIAIRLLNSNGDSIDRIIFNFENRCENIPILFHNTIGGYDTANFSRVARNVEGASTEGISPYIGIGADNIRQRTRKVYDQKATTVISLFSGWHDDESYINYLAHELMLTDEAYCITDENGGNWTPIIITTKKTTTRKGRVQFLFGLTIDVELMPTAQQRASAYTNDQAQAAKEIKWR